jgi:hypothetical protein
MKNNEKNIEKIYDLLQAKNSKELNIEEIKIVKDEINSLNEYDNLKLVSNASYQYLNKEESLIPEPQVFKSLKYEINRKSKTRNIITYKIPAYQAVAACLAIFIFSILLFKSGTNIEQKEKIKYITIEKIIIDTIKITENAIPQIAINNAVNMLESKTHVIRNMVHKKMINENSEETESQNMFVGFRNLKHLENQKRGVSIADDSILRKFRFTVLSRN